MSASWDLPAVPDARATRCAAVCDRQARPEVFWWSASGGFFTEKYLLSKKNVCVDDFDWISLDFGDLFRLDVKSIGFSLLSWGTLKRSNDAFFRGHMLYLKKCVNPRDLHTTIFEKDICAHRMRRKWRLKYLQARTKNTIIEFLNALQHDIWNWYHFCDAIQIFLGRCFHGSKNTWGWDQSRPFWRCHSCLKECLDFWCRGETPQGFELFSCAIGPRFFGAYRPTISRFLCSWAFKRHGKLQKIRKEMVGVVLLSSQLWVKNDEDEIDHRQHLEQHPPFLWNTCARVDQLLILRMVIPPLMTGILIILGL